MTDTSVRFRTLIAVGALAAGALLVAACGDDDDAEEAQPTNDVAARICVEGAEDSIWCGDTAEDTPQPDATETSEPAPSPEACSDAQSCEDNSIEISRRDLAAQLSVEVESVTVVSSDPEQWPDACLGAAKPGTVCAQVITPGFKIVLEADGTEYEYHTDNGARAVLIE